MGEGIQEQQMTLIPIDSRDGVIWFDGKFVPWKDAKIHVLTHGLHYGSCVFEGERAYNGRIFKSRQHSERLHKSAELLGFQIPYSVDEIEKAKQELIAKQNVVNGYLRPVAWRGSEQLSVSAQKNTIHLAIATWEWPSYFSKELKEKGIKLIHSRWVRPAPNMAPTASKAAGLYMICTMSKHDAEAAGCQDALMLDYRGYIAEATGANIFLIKNGEIHTPIADCFLNGITRQTVIELAREHGMKLTERHIKPEELKDFTEVFLTGSAAEVTPVGQIGDLHFTPGAITQKLMQAYHDLVTQAAAPTNSEKTA
jgi:branched-chain amino acid aminotransferase